MPSSKAGSLEPSLLNHSCGLLIFCFTSQWFGGVYSYILHFVQEEENSEKKILFVLKGAVGILG